LPIRRRVLGHRTVRLLDLDFCDVLAFVSGWHPPVGEFQRSRARWQTWPEYFAEYELLRDQVLATSFARGYTEQGESPPAELNYQAWVAAGRPAEWWSARQCQECGAPHYSCDCRDWWTETDGYTQPWRPA